ncbi:MAG: tetratricopeptide repeat protein [Candidatus Obscuribacterales bacterium]|nr:tetratricopeptide repeat protein [Candidatus Obscuribacterales bacterium]
MLKLNKALTFFACSLALSSLSSVFAAVDAKFSQAVSTYLREDYAKALSLFQALAKADPNDGKLHYYMAICHIRLKDKDKGVQEYNWILKNSKDEALKEIVTARLLKIRPDLASKLKVKESELAAKHGPLREVILFSTTWCPTCKEFEPTWERAKLKMGRKIKFVHLNAEDASAWKEVELYRPKAYPTIVYLDADRKVIENHADAPTAAVFMNHLKALAASK